MAQVRNGSFTTTAYSGRSITFSWSLKSQNIEKNTSTISWSFTGSGTGTSWFYTQNAYLNVNGIRVYTQSGTAQLAPGTVLASGESTISHGTDGKKTFNANGGGGIYVYNTIQVGSGNWELPQIPRAATLTAAPHFTDEENPTITYSNPAGESVESLQTCIANASGTIVYADYRSIPKTGTSYTFNLTEEEREALRWGTINSNTLTVKFYVTTMIAGVRYESTLDKILTIANAQPTLEASAIDNGNTSLKLTGDNNKIIKGFNYVVATQTAQAYKGASIKKQTIICDGITKEGTNVNFRNVESNVFTFTATDSRGNTVSKTITKELIDYKKLTCDLKTENVNAVGLLNFEISGNYFSGSFGTTENTLNVYYRFKKEGGNFTNWIEVTPTITNNTYSVNVQHEGLDYKETYIFQAKASDKINTNILSIEKKVVSIPIFSWGKNDFKFEVDVFDKNGVKLGTELTTKDYEALFRSGNSFLESGFVTITPTAPSTPTGVFVAFKRHYDKIPIVLVTASSGVIGSQVLGASTNGITNDGVNIVLNRTNTTPTTVHFYVFGGVEE
jgi:hypothetical protein